MPISADADSQTHVQGPSNVIACDFIHAVGTLHEPRLGRLMAKTSGLHFFLAALPGEAINQTHCWLRPCCKQKHHCQLLLSALHQFCSLGSLVLGYSVTVLGDLTLVTECLTVTTAMLQCACSPYRATVVLGVHVKGPG